MRTLIISLLILALLPVALSPVGVDWKMVVDVLYHEMKLNVFERNFDGVSHPSDSILIKRISDLGLLGGNSNHCDYLVVELRASEKQREEIRRLYDTQFVMSPEPHDATPDDRVCVQVLLNPSESESGIPRVFDNMLLHEQEKWRATGWKVYAVYVFDMGHSARSDPRCH